MAPRSQNTIAGDHDLLIEIKTRLELLQSTVQESRSALSQRIERLATEKASYSDLDPLRKTLERFQTDVGSKADKDDFEGLADKVDSTRRLVWIGVGVLATLQVLAPFFWAQVLR